tara:strand:+ start:2395 stop:2628 length:234 start_codon:yes stop_codon:yes gene_type:complete
MIYNDEFSRGLFLHIRDKLIVKFEQPHTDDIIIGRGDLRFYLGNYAIPKPLHDKAIKCMEENGFIKVLNKKHISIMR